MQRRYELYRGDEFLGFVGSDDQWPCEPFEAAPAFEALADLFAKEHELSMLACEMGRIGKLDQEEALFIEADKLMEQILEPGVRMKALHPIDCSFECIDLSIHDGRVCWR
ncbi:hypothetical protein LOC67_09430 [Stieleria sp. JC731]|uniref:hypothetical protein n=1 Tax=Pirellulaceae TaxID=2691357 RepID=UPI001E5AFADE|nr:hypothetical protein [Stieleria sp. JC731]MCC9600785.1 hypothetical protein [Stieleria sp. JC731]